MATTTVDLTPNEMLALEALRKYNEGVDGYSSKNGEEWASVYLDNAKPVAWSGRAWAAILGSLEKKGLYRVDDGYAFGLVLLNS